MPNEIMKVSTSELIKEVNRFSKRSKSFHNDMHVLAVSVLFHAAEHGDCRPLDRFYNDALPRAYQVSFKLFVKRIMDPKGFDTGVWLTFERETFNIVSETTEARQKFKRLAEEGYPSEDEGEDVPPLIDGDAFFTYNPINEAKIFDTMQLVKRIDQLIRDVKKDDARVGHKEEILHFLDATKKDIARVENITIQ